MITPLITIIIGAIVGYFVAKWQFKFQSIHQRRLEVIEEAYNKLKLANRSFQFLTNPIQEIGEIITEEKEKDFGVKADDMTIYLDTKRLFFSTDEQKSIDEINKKFIETWGSYRYKKAIQDDRALGKERLDLYQKIWTSTSVEIPRLIEKLESVFKKALSLK